MGVKTGILAWTMGPGPDGTREVVDLGEMTGDQVEWMTMMGKRQGDDGWIYVRRLLKWARDNVRSVDLLPMIEEAAGLEPSSATAGTPPPLPPGGSPASGAPA